MTNIGMIGVRSTSFHQTLSRQHFKELYRDVHNLDTTPSSSSVVLDNLPIRIPILPIVLIS